MKCLFLPLFLAPPLKDSIDKSRNWNELPFDEKNISSMPYNPKTWNLFVFLHRDRLNNLDYFLTRAFLLGDETCIQTERKQFL